MENTYDIETYIDKLEGELVRICRECGFPVTSAPKEKAASQTAPSMLLSSPDIDRHWQKLGGDYIADAMPQIADYPTVAVAWTAYLGMWPAVGILTGQCARTCLIQSIMAVKVSMTWMTTSSVTLSALT